MKLLLASFVVGMWCYAIYVSLYLASKRGELTMTWLILGLPPLVIGYVIDVLIFNWLIATAVYWEWPSERTFSARVNRWYRYYKKGIDESKINRIRYNYTMWWARQLNALTPSQFEHIHKHDRL